MDRPDARRTLATVLMALALAGCGVSPTPSATGSPAPSATTAPAAPVMPTAAPTPTAPTPLPTATPAPGILPPGSLAFTVSDQLVVRSQPRVSTDSVIYRPYLPTGTELLVIAGPVAASGYRWYHVEPIDFSLDGGVTEGWVAMADHDGTPWVALAEGPLAGLELASSAVARAPASAAEAATGASSVNAFGLDLYHRLLVDKTLGLAKKNVVFSPTSIVIALAMARAGAKGDTAAEMDAVLHASGWGELGAGLNALEQELAAHDATWKDDGGKTHALSLRMANAAFGQRGFPIEQPYLDAIAAAFGAGLALVDYIADPEAARKTINAWVSRQTAKRIPELLSPQDVGTLTRLVLVNAIYLKANWQVEFGVDATNATKSRAFTRLDGSRIEVPTMSLFGGQSVPYASGTGWKAIELRYLGAEGSTPLAMTLVLPDDLASFEAQLTTGKLEGIISKLDRERQHLDEVTYSGSGEMDCGTYAYSLHLFMPRFGIETRAGLKDLLVALGMPAAFDGRADFSGVTTAEQLAISEVIHQANIDVDEKGTEAAAATAIVMNATGGCGGAEPAKTITLRLDRPFLFILRDVETGAVLFMGRVVDPSAK